jgi:ATP-dependent exoDNAse (exonuclease V) alpha subunit
MHGNSIIYPTESIIKILDVTPAVSDEGLDGFNIRFPRVNAKFYPKNWSEADSLLKFYRKNQAWRKFFKIKEDYLDIRSLHALTCHKAQGSTYKEVFVDLDDIGINKKYYEVARLVYVAITRASDKVYLYGKLPDRWRQ